MRRARGARHDSSAQDSGGGTGERSQLPICLVALLEINKANVCVRCCQTVYVLSETTSDRYAQP